MPDAEQIPPPIPHRLFLILLLIVVTILSIMMLGTLWQTTRQQTSKRPPSIAPPANTEPTAINGVDSDVRWETYTNADLNISFEYPPHWSISEHEKGVIIQGDSNTIDVFIIDEMVGRYSPYQWYEYIWSAEFTVDEETEVLAKEPFLHDTLPGVKLTEWFDGEFTVIYLPSQQRIARIQIHPTLEEGNTQINRTLSTFRFLESDTSVSLLTPKTDEVLVKGQTYRVAWEITNPPADAENWLVTGSLVSEYVGAAESKVGREIFSHRLSEDQGYFDWEVSRSFREDWFDEKFEKRPINDVRYMVRVCLVQKDAGEIFDMGYWADPSAGRLFCNPALNGFGLRIISPSAPPVLQG